MDRSTGRSGLSSGGSSGLSFLSPTSSLRGSGVAFASGLQLAASRPRSPAALATVASVLHHQAAYPNTSVRVDPAGVLVRGPPPPAMPVPPPVPPQPAATNAPMPTAPSQPMTTTTMTMLPLHKSHASHAPAISLAPGSVAAYLMSSTAASQSAVVHTPTPPSQPAAPPHVPVAAPPPVAAPSPPPAPAPLPHPNDALIAQIEDQWNEYMGRLSSESSKSSSASPGVGPSAALPVLIARLHSNSLLNFFEFTQSRQVLTIYGPSFDCLYYNPPPPPPSHLYHAHNAAPPPAVSTIYRDRADYIHTLGNLTTLVFKYVDFQLVSLQLPLIRQRMSKLRHLRLVANNLHSLYQLDDLALLAPTPPPPPNAYGHTSNSSGASSSHLESVTLSLNSVADSQLYRRYMLSILTINVLQVKDAVSATSPAWSPQRSSRASRGSMAASTSGAHALTTLDGRAVTDDEVWESWCAFGRTHRAKYVLNAPLVMPTSAGHQLVASRWLEMIGEISLAHHGGAAALGTAANPLHTVAVPSSGVPAASMITLPLRPVAAPAAARKQAKRAVEDALSRALSAAQHARAFESAWSHAVHGADGVVATTVSDLRRSGGREALVADAPDAHPLVALAAAASLHPSPHPSHLSHTSSASSLHRLQHDKTRMMKAYLASANPTAQLASSAAAAAAAQRRRRG